MERPPGASVAKFPAPRGCWLVSSSGSFRLFAISREGGAIEAAMRKSGKFAGTSRYYEIAKAVLWAGWRAGQELNAMDRKKVSGPGRGHLGDKTNSHGATSFYSKLKKLKLAKTTAYRWITMSFASREEVEEYLAPPTTGNPASALWGLLRAAEGHRRSGRRTWGRRSAADTPVAKSCGIARFGPSPARADAPSAVSPSLPASCLPPRARTPPLTSPRPEAPLARPAYMA